MKQPNRDAKRTTRTCVGCGLRDDRAAMVRLTIAGGEVVFDALFRRGGGMGHGVHLHPRAGCIAGAPRGLARAFKTDVRIDPAEIGQRLVITCETRMVGLLLAARRLRALAIGADAANAALSAGAPLAIVAADADSARKGPHVQQAIVTGRAIAWKTKCHLGGLLGEKAVAICAVRHAGIASELKLMRAAADAGMAATREGAECSRRPEAR